MLLLIFGEVIVTTVTNFAVRMGRDYRPPIVLCCRYLLPIIMLLLEDNFGFFIDLLLLF